VKKIIIISTVLLFACTMDVWAQAGNDAVRTGNRLYKQGNYKEALPQYQKAAAQDPANPVTRYNLGNAQFRSNQYGEAEKEYDATIANSKNDSFSQKAIYNKGVALSKQKKLLESIEVYKKAVKMDPNDADARFNLQKALSELKKETEQDQKKQQQQQQKQQQQKQPPREQPRKVNNQQIQQWLNSLRQKEQEVQRKMQENRSRSVNRPEKDW
jgi:Ca-activated chloride channel homolog